jgi:hypothetical protein
MLSRIKEGSFSTSNRRPPEPTACCAVVVQSHELDEGPNLITNLPVDLSARSPAHLAVDPGVGPPAALPPVAASSRSDSVRGDWRARPAADALAASPPRHDRPGVEARPRVAQEAGG